MSMMSRDPNKLFPHDYVFKYTLVPLIPLWLTPNMITISRFVLTPVVLWFLFKGQFEIGVPLFIAVAIGDALDGSLARLRKQITAWGTFYDPVADKIFIGSIVLLIVMKNLNIYLAIVIVSLEMLIILGGYFRRLKGFSGGANVFGKTKMILQVIGVSFLLLALWLGVDLFIPFSAGTLSLAILFAVISLFTYGL